MNQKMETRVFRLQMVVIVRDNGNVINPTGPDDQRVEEIVGDAMTVAAKLITSDFRNQHPLADLDIQMDMRLDPTEKS